MRTRRPCGCAGGIVSGPNGLDVAEDAGTTPLTSFEKLLVVVLLYAFTAK
jgi:hypothetical protein